MPRLTFIGWQRADGGLLRELGHLFARELRVGEDRRGEPHRRAFEVALDAGGLARYVERLASVEAQEAVEHARRADEEVPVHHALAHELRVLERRYEAEDALLLSPLQIGLEADDVEERPFGVVLPQLHDGVGSFSRVRRLEADGAQRAEEQRLLAALRYHLDGQAAVAKWRICSSSKSWRGAVSAFTSSRQKILYSSSFIGQLM